MHRINAQGKLGRGFRRSASHAATIRRVTAFNSSRAAMLGRSSICKGLRTPFRNKGSA